MPREEKQLQCGRCAADILAGVLRSHSVIDRRYEHVELYTDGHGRTAMVDYATAPYAVFFLRLCLGSMFIAHALLKVRVYTIPGTVAMFKSLGLPGWFAYLIIAVELIGGACLILGIVPRYVALLLIPEILGTIVTVHGKNGWLFTNKDGGWEYPAFWAAALLVQFLLGDGAWALVPSPPLPFI
jgi:putative oxidoreductase